MGNIMKSIGQIFSPKIPSAKLPALPAMPDPEAPALKIAARKKVEEKRTRGREGTIYSGGSYSNQNLAGTQ